MLTIDFMDLNSYLEKAKTEHGISVANFAKKARISKVYIYEILALKKLPSPDIAKKIQIASNGIVTAIELAEPFYRLKEDEVNAD